MCALQGTQKARFCGSSILSFNYFVPLESTRTCIYEHPLHCNDSRVGIFWNAITTNYLKYYILVTIAECWTKRIRGVGWTSSVQYHWSFTWLQLLRNGIPFGVRWDLIHTLYSSKIQPAVWSSEIPDSLYQHF